MLAGEAIMLTLQNRLWVCVSFRGLYFRKPNGILFEIATDGPGFATDEPIETLGEWRCRPSWCRAAPRSRPG